MVKLSAFGICVATLILLMIPEDSCVEIIGGKEVEKNSRPYMALILGKNKLCGGALIKSNWVLTAAHCKNGNTIKVVLGAHSRSKPEKGKQEFTVIEEFPYPCYDNSTGENDLMLLKLNKPAQSNTVVKTLRLPSPDQKVNPKSKCRIAGWGVTGKKDTEGSDVLMEVNVSVIDRKKCNTKYYDFKPVITNNMICAGDKKKDSCVGDSGGPLICDDKFVAICSFGHKKCGTEPGVYTLLSNLHIQWIHKITGGDE